MHGWMVGSISLNLWYGFRSSGISHFKYLYAIIHVVQLSVAFGFSLYIFFYGYSFHDHFVHSIQKWVYARYNIYGYRVFALSLSRYFIEKLFLDTTRINVHRTTRWSWAKNVDTTSKSIRASNFKLASHISSLQKF